MDTSLNSVSEISFRILLGLSVYGGAMTESRIASLDFISTYAHKYGITEINLNGDGEYILAEYSYRKNVVHESIIHLVRCGLLNPKIEQSIFLYSITGKGFYASSQFLGKYADCFRVTYEKVSLYLQDKSDREIVSFIMNT